MPKAHDITNKRFSKLTAIKFSHIHKKSRMWLCKCDCGNELFTTVGKLNSGHTKSCGCLTQFGRGKDATKHGMYKSPEYRSWISMKSRCNNHKNIAFHNYGARGIKICKRWEKFENFWEDMGRKPSKKHSIERIDNNKGYFPDNCKWANKFEQLSNTRRNHFITINGKTKILFQWLRHYGIKPATYTQRRKRGWNKIDSITKPLHFRHSHPSS